MFIFCCHYYYCLLKKIITLFFFKKKCVAQGSDTSRDARCQAPLLPSSLDGIDALGFDGYVHLQDRYYIDTTHYQVSPLCCCCCCLIFGDSNSDVYVFFRIIFSIRLNLSCALNRFFVSMLNVMPSILTCGSTNWTKTVKLLMSLIVALGKRDKNQTNWYSLTHFSFCNFFFVAVSVLKKQSSLCFLAMLARRADTRFASK